MGSKIIGRAQCPECGFKAAHIKQSEKCVYRYCPECHSQTFARTDRQAEQMRKGMTPVAPEAAAAATATAPATGTGSDPLPPVAVPPVAAPAPARRAFFSVG